MNNCILRKCPDGDIIFMDVFLSNLRGIIYGMNNNLSSLFTPVVV